MDVLEQRFGVDTPFNSIYKLNAVVKRAKDTAHIEWCFCSITDKLTSGANSPCDFTNKSLSGTSHTGSKGLVDVYILRHQVMRHAGYTLLEKLEPAGYMRDKFWEVFESHAKYRANLNPVADSAVKADLAWRGGWPRSIIAFFTWVEEMVFKDDYYQQLSTAVRNSKGPVDFMEYDTVAMKWQTIFDARKAELEAAKAALAGTETSAPGADGTGGAAALARLDPPEEDPDAALKQEADRTVDANAAVAVESESTSEMKNKIASSAAGKTLGNAGAGRCLIH